jgi:urease accessory protein
MIVNPAGGIAGGDRHDLDIAVGDGATLAVTTAAAEKIYRVLGPQAEIAIKLAVGDGARLSWLPQETILFDRARLNRRIEVELAPDATLVMAEAVIFGRAAMGEAVEEGAFTDRWRVRRDGRLVFAETVRLDGAIARMLAEPAVAGGGLAVATVLAAPGEAAMVERARAQTFCGEVGVSAWNGLAVARLCAKDGASLRRDLASVIVALGGTLPRLWSN